MFADIQGVVFDAYGTLFDVHAPAVRLAGRIGPQFEAFSKHWRQKQLEYTWLRSLMRRHADFATVTADALDHAMESFRLDDPALRAELLATYDKLDAYPDAVATLQALAAMKLRTGILSNGTPGMLNASVISAGLEDWLDEVISVEAVGIYKPDPRVYALALDRFGIRESARILFVSANGWDAHAAAAFGFSVVRVNRNRMADERLPGRPGASVEDLSSIPALISG